MHLKGREGQSEFLFSGSLSKCLQQPGLGLELSLSCPHGGGGWWAGIQVLEALFAASQHSSKMLQLRIERGFKPGTLTWHGAFQAALNCCAKAALLFDFASGIKQEAV